MWKHKTDSGTVSAVILLILIAGIVAACSNPTPPPTPTPKPLAKELIFYNWDGDQVESVLTAFNEEYGVKVTYLPYDSQEEAVENMKAGEVYDLVVLENNFLPAAIADSLLAEIDYRQVPNFNNTLANFRDLSYDPGNKHSAPFTWGTVALLVRNDLDEPITRWADLWNLKPDQKIALRDSMREPLGVSLKSLGYSFNSEKPAEVEAALEHLLKLKDQIILVDSYAEGAIPVLESGEAVALVGWAEDAQYVQDEGIESIDYVFPEDGSMLWGDSFVIPANTPNKETAELFLDFLLRPEISAQIVNETYYATTNEAATPFIEAEIRDDPIIFPPREAMKNAEVLSPLSLEATKMYEEAWARFKAAQQP